MAKRPRETITEVMFTQEPFDSAVDYHRWIIGWPKGFKPDHEWKPLSDRRRGWLKSVARLTGGYVQTASIFAHEAPRRFAVPDTEPIVGLFKKIARLRPLKTEEEVEICFGISRRGKGIYMRGFGPPHRLVPYSSGQELADEFDDRIGVEEADDFCWDSGEWLVAYLHRVSQREFQDAFVRLNLLYEVLYEASGRMYKVAERHFRKRLKDYLIPHEE